MKKAVGLIIVVGIVAAILFVPSVRRAATGLFEQAKEGSEKPDVPTVSDVVRPSEELQEEEEGDNVYFRRGDEKYYHRRNCPDCVGESLVPRSLEQARMLREPCPLCKPPE